MCLRFFLVGQCVANDFGLAKYSDHVSIDFTKCKLMVLERGITVVRMRISTVSCVNRLHNTQRTVNVNLFIQRNMLTLPFAENTAREIDRANILHSNDSDRAARKRCVSTQDTNIHGKSGLRQLYHKFQHDAQKKAVHGSDTVSEKCIDVNGMNVPGQQKPPKKKQEAGVCGRASLVGAEVARKQDKTASTDFLPMYRHGIDLGPAEELCHQ